MMFIDSGGGMDRNNSRVFLLLAPSVAGALPTGVLILSSEKESVLTRALELHKSMIPEASFYGRGRDIGPRIAITDDSTSERNSLCAVYQNITLLLCAFHVLQAFWRYIWKADRNVAKEDRPYIYNLFHSAVFKKDLFSFDEIYEKILQDSTVTKYKIVIKHLKDLRTRSPEWALCHRRDLLTRGHDTNNYSEAMMRVLKDIILKRIKAFSIVQLFDFLSVRLDTYFEMRISSVISNRMPNYSSSRYYIPETKLKPLSCSKISDSHYSVTNSEKKTEYIVNMDIELCECPVGYQGAPCKHQFAVVKAYSLSSDQFLPFMDVPTKMHLHYIMSSTHPSRDFYENLTSVSTTSKTDLNCNLSRSNGPFFSELEEQEELLLSRETGEDGDDSFEDTEFKRQFENFYIDLKDRIDKNPDVKKCTKTFLMRYAECKTDAALEHALCTFNRYKGQVPTNLQKKNTPNKVKRSSRIPIRADSVTRRTGPHMGGRSCQITGRPSKSARREIDYAKQPIDPNWIKPPSKPFHAPQKLADCVAFNIPLGKRK